MKFICSAFSHTLALISHQVHDKRRARFVFPAWGAPRPTDLPQAQSCLVQDAVCSSSSQSSQIGDSQVSSARAPDIHGHAHIIGEEVVREEGNGALFFHYLCLLSWGRMPETNKNKKRRKKKELCQENIFIYVSLRWEVEFMSREK